MAQTPRKTPVPKPKVPAAVEPEQEITSPAPAPVVPAGHVKVRTTGSFLLLDVTTGAEIKHTGTSTVPDSVFIQERIASGDLEVVK